MRLEAYETGEFHDEMFDEYGAARPEARLLLEAVSALEEGQQAADRDRYSAQAAAGAAEMAPAPSPAGTQLPRHLEELSG